MKSKYNPDYISMTGDSIKELLKDKNKTIEDIRKHTKLTKEQVQDVIDGKCRMPTLLAEALEKEVGVSKKFWLIRDELCWKRKRCAMRDNILKYKESLSKMSFFGYFKERGLKSFKNKLKNIIAKMGRYFTQGELVKTEDAMIEHEEWTFLQVELHIDKLMREKGVDAERLSIATGIPEKEILDIFNGEDISIRQAARIFTALDCSMVIKTKPLCFETTL